jgi:hypothetical protein
MTDNDLLALHKSFHEVSLVASLRAVFDAGYLAGSGGTPSAQMVSPSATQAKPSDANISTLKTYHSQKH